MLILLSCKNWILAGSLLLVTTRGMFRGQQLKNRRVGRHRSKGIETGRYIPLSPLIKADENSNWRRHRNSLQYYDDPVINTDIAAKKRRRRASVGVTRRLHRKSGGIQTAGSPSNKGRQKARRTSAGARGARKRIPPKFVPLSGHQKQGFGANKATSGSKRLQKWFDTERQAIIKSFKTIAKYLDSKELRQISDSRSRQKFMDQYTGRQKFIDYSTREEWKAWSLIRSHNYLYKLDLCKGYGIFDNCYILPDRVSEDFCYRCQKRQHSPILRRLPAVAKGLGRPAVHKGLGLPAVPKG